MVSTTLMERAVEVEQEGNKLESDAVLLDLLEEVEDAVVSQPQSGKNTSDRIRQENVSRRSERPRFNYD